MAEILARKPAAVGPTEELPIDRPVPNQIGLVLSFRTSQLSGFGTELILSAKMLEVVVSNNRTETLSALENLAGKPSQSTCCRRSGFFNKYHSYAPAP